jgi:hypothetical protein
MVAQLPWLEQLHLRQGIPNTTIPCPSKRPIQLSLQRDLYTYLRRWKPCRAVSAQWTVSVELQVFCCCGLSKWLQGVCAVPCNTVRMHKMKQGQGQVARVAKPQAEQARCAGRKKEDKGWGWDSPERKKIHIAYKQIKRVKEQENALDTDLCVQAGRKGMQGNRNGPAMQGR